MVLAVAWAVYLVPKALKHHDEVARTRSVDRFSTAMRVLARREPVDSRNARLVLTPARSSGRMVAPARPQPSVAARRAAARAAARRRRRVLLMLLLGTAVVAALAGLALVPWWSLAIPLGLTLLFLVLARTQVRRQDDAQWSPVAVAARISERPSTEIAPETVAPRRAIRVETSYAGASAPVHRTADGTEFSPDEDTVQIAVSELQAVAVPVETVDGGSLWDPLPVTLPTYVTKARAARTVRTIDLTAPGAWSSGRDETDTALVEQTAAESVQAPEDVADDQRRAVGS